jgi:hypothetical protein
MIFGLPALACTWNGLVRSGFILIPERQTYFFARPVSEFD